MTDEQIVELYWVRDEQAIHCTDEKYGPYCRTVAGNILQSPEDCEECVNDTYLRTWNTIPPSRPSKLRMFLAKITRNLAFDRYKAQAAEKRGGGETAAVLHELAECIASDACVEQEVIAKELEQSVNRFVSSLPERERNVFVRRYFFTEPVSKIGQMYGITANHVMVILSRARQKLRQHLQKEGYIL